MNVVQPQPVIDSLAAFHHYGTFWLESKRKLPFPFLFYVVKKEKKNWQGKLRDTEGKGETYLSIKNEKSSVTSIRSDALYPNDGPYC